jgi:hypothetical protein
VHPTVGLLKFRNVAKKIGIFKLGPKKFKKMAEIEKYDKIFALYSQSLPSSPK